MHIILYFLNVLGVTYVWIAILMQVIYMQIHKENIRICMIIQYVATLINFINSQIL